DERVELRPKLGVVVERPHADRDLISVWPPAAEEARPADGAERLDGASLRLVDGDQLLAREQAEPLARDPRLHARLRAGVLSAARAVAVVRVREGRLDLEADPAAEAASTHRRRHPGQSRL